MSMTSEERQIRRLKMLSGIKRYLLRHLGGTYYMGQVRSYLYWASDEEFNAVVTEMVESGTLDKLPGSKGGISLRLNEPEEVHG